MPNLEEHCKHCLDLFGIEGREVHKWLDEPSRLYGGEHRVIRHDQKTAMLIGKMFGKYYGEGLLGESWAETIFYAHLIQDTEASKKKGLEAHPFTEKQKQELEEEQPRYLQELAKIQKRIRELDELPPLSIREMKDYIAVKFAHKRPELKLLAEVSLRHWQKFVLSRDTSNREIGEVDINGFVAQLSRKVTSYTRANYIGQLVLYFKCAYSEELALLMQKEKSKADDEVAELKKNALPLRINDIKRFYREVKPPMKVAMRLLLLEEDIAIDDLGKISVIHDSNSGIYHFFVEKSNSGRVLKTEIHVDNDTATLAIPLLKRNKGKLVKGNRRSLAELFQRWSYNLHFEPNITPMDLRKFGSNHHPDDIREFVLSDKEVANVVTTKG